MNEKRWERNLADAARGYNEPPATPRERMWQRIDTAREEARQATGSVGHPPWWSRRQVLWPAAVVAALVVGLTIGRTTVESDLGSSTPVIATTSSSRDVSQESQTYRLAAMPVLHRSETMLLQLRTSADPISSYESYSGRAAGLLTQTRLLLASPAKNDPELKRLLEDLELALVRIVRLAATPRPVSDEDPERRILEDGLKHNAVLPRIHDQLSARAAAVGL